MNRILLNDIPVKFAKDEFSKYCQINESSPFYDTLDEYIKIVENIAKPKAILKWCKVDCISGDNTTIERITFKSKVVADKLKGIEKVFFVVGTAGEEIKKTDEIEDEVLKDIFSGAILVYAMKYVNNYLDEYFGMKSIAALQPGSLPDWPIENNKVLCKMIGGVSEDIGVSLNEAGYMMPWNSFSGILFTDDAGYKNCMLCKNYDCIGRQAPFNQDEYNRIFG